MLMADQAEIEELAKQVATANLGVSSVSSVNAASIVDFDGKDALQITIVLMPGISTAVLDGSQVVNTMVQVHDRLQRAGEERYPFMSFMADEEWRKSAASKS